MVLYIYYQLIKIIYKCGRTNNIKDRKNALQTGLIDEINILYIFNCKNVVLLENIVHNILEIYRYSKREHFDCNLEYIKVIIYIFGSLINILNIYENINENNLLDIIYNKINRYKYQKKVYINKLENCKLNKKNLYIIKTNLPNIISLVSSKSKIDKNIIYSYETKNITILEKMIKNIIKDNKLKLKNVYFCDNIQIIIKIINIVDNILNVINDSKYNTIEELFININKFIL